VSLQEKHKRLRERKGLAMLMQDLLRLQLVMFREFLPQSLLQKSRRRVLRQPARNRTPQEQIEDITATLGELSVGAKKLTASSSSRVLCVPIGTGAMDVAVASVVLQRAEKEGIGDTFNFVINYHNRFLRVLLVLEKLLFRDMKKVLFQTNRYILF
jgi:hypothetical protein